MEKINDTNYELWLLRYAEQELTAEERVAVEQWLEVHPEAAEEMALYNEAPRLEKDESVHYVAAVPQHTLPLWPAVVRWSAAAAVVAALMVPVARMTIEPAPRLQDNMVATVQQDSIIEEIEETAVETMPEARKPLLTKAVEEEQTLVAEVIVVEENVEDGAEERVEEVSPVVEETVDPKVIYCDDLIVYDPPQDTIYTNSLIDYDDSRRSWTENVRDWASETKAAQWFRRRFKARGSELLAMND